MVCHGKAIAVRSDYSAGSSAACEAVEGCRAGARLLAIAAVLDGASREDAAKIGGMERQTLRDWVIRFNEHEAGRMSATILPRSAPQARL